MVALGHDIEDVASSFDMAVPALRNVLRSAYAAQVRSNPGHTREAPFADPEETGGAR